MVAVFISGNKAEASSNWDIRYYSKLNFKGKEVKAQTKNIDFTWGTGQPVKGIPKNNFSAKMTKTITVKEGGRYKIVGKANDGVRVYVNGKLRVDHWKNGTHTFDRTIMLAKGKHKIEIHYFDRSGNAFITADVKKAFPKLSTTTWKGKFYPSKDFTGTPVTTSEKTLNKSWKSAKPHAKIPVGTYSAIYEKKLNVTKKTQYMIMGKANDGIRVYVNGKRYISHWNTGTKNFERNITLNKGVHTIRVEYFNTQGSATLKVDVKEAAKVTPLEKWAVTYYDKKDLTGNKVRATANQIHYQWGMKAPIAKIPSNHFSVKFEKRTRLESDGTYIISGGANDGIRVYVDGKKVIDFWKNGTHVFNEEIKLNKGIHIITVHYYDNTGDARVKVDFARKSKKQTVTSSRYPITLNSALAKQMNVTPQTDKKYGAYVPKNSVKLASTTSGTTTKQVPVITTSSRTLTTLQKNTRIIIQGERSFNNTNYYKIATGWVNASKSDTKYYLDPLSFTNKKEKEYYQYLKLSAFSGLNEKDINAKILHNKGILKNRANAFLKAGFKYNVNEIYLISHASLETGNGASRLANGIKVNVKRDSKGKIIYNQNGEQEITVLADHAKKYDAKVYNMYGIGAYDSCAMECGARRAFNEGWTSPNKAIIEGAKFAAENYIHAGQDTLYKMRWNPDSLMTKGYASHQYATDIGWAIKQTKSFEQLYGLLNSYNNVYDFPIYR